MAIYQRCQQPTSRKVLLQLHQLPLFPPSCASSRAHLPHDRLHVAIKVFDWRRGRAAATATRRGKQRRNQKQIQVPPPRPMEHDAALTRTSVYVKIQYVMHLVSCFPSPPFHLSLSSTREDCLSVPPRAPCGLTVHILNAFRIALQVKDRIYTLRHSGSNWTPSNPSPFRSSSSNSAGTRCAALKCFQSLFLCCLSQPAVEACHCRPHRFAFICNSPSRELSRQPN